jgi:hypothetical protein
VAQFVAASDGILANASAAETLCLLGLCAALAVLLRCGVGFGSAHVEDACAYGCYASGDGDEERSLLTSSEYVLWHCGCVFWFWVGVYVKVMK